MTGLDTAARVEKAGKARQALALTALCLGFLMITLDATIVNVALPAIRASLGGDVGELQWVADAYTLALAAVLLSAGTAADILGARRVFLAGLTAFVLASVVCALSPDLPALIIARGVQGLGAAGLLPPSLTLIVHQFPDPKRRAHALGVWGGMSGIGLAAGPVLGGLAVATLGWEAIFLVNVPVGIAAIVLTRMTVVAGPRRPGARFDLAGQLLAALALGCLAAGLIRAGQGSGTAVVVLLVVGVLAAVAFTMAERRVATPMLPPRVFRNRAFTAATAVGMLFNFCLYGTLFCLPLYLQQVRGQSALTAGLALLPMTAVVGTNAFLGGRVTGRFGPRVPMVLGSLAGATGAVMLALAGPVTPLVQVLAGSMVFGFVSLAMPAMTSVAMHALPAHQSGMASGVLNAARQTGSALGFALLGSLLVVGGGIDLDLPFAIVAACYVGAAMLALTATTTSME